MSEGIPNDEHFPHLIVVENSDVSYKEFSKRMQRIMRDLPDLKQEYEDQIIAKGLFTKESMSLENFAEICRNLSLRYEPFVEWNQDYFDEYYDEMVRIAMERGSRK